MANALMPAPFFPQEQEPRVVGHAYYGIATIGPPGAIWKAQRQPYDEPWQFTLARICEAGIVALLIVLAVLAIRAIS